MVSEQVGLDQDKTVSIIKVKVVLEQVGLDQDSSQEASEQEDLDLRQVKTVSEQVVLGQQDKAITMVGLVVTFNKS